MTLEYKDIKKIVKEKNKNLNDDTIARLTIAMADGYLLALKHTKMKIEKGLNNV